MNNSEKIRNEAEEEKEGKDCIINMLLFICYLVTFILIIIWVFKLHNNAKKEPSSRNKYIIEDLLTFYTEEEFCYEKYEPFLVKGALDTFDIPSKKIKKYCKALLSTIFISLGSIILTMVFFCLKERYKFTDKRKKFFRSLYYTFYIIFCLGIILSFVFAIILVHYYSKGDYNDFDEFTRCRYLSKQFRSDYNFVSKIRKGYQMPIALILLNEFFSFIKLIFEFQFVLKI